MPVAPIVLLVGGDLPTRTMLRFLLQDDGCEVIEVPNPSTITYMPAAKAAVLAVVVMDEHAVDATPPLAALRRAGYRVPTVVLAHSANLTLRRSAFSLGAIDVICLPAATRDLQARLRAGMGDRAPASAPRSNARTLSAGGLVLEVEPRVIRDGTGWQVHLTPRETGLLATLLSRPGQAISRAELLDHVWGNAGIGDGNTLDVYVRRIREKLVRPQCPHGYVRTVRGQGYMFDARSSPRLAVRTEVTALPRVLVVDDDPATVLMITSVLNEAGYETAHGVGAEALVLAQRLKPAVILLDINMLGMDGVEVRRHLQEDALTATIPVIALSAGRNLRKHVNDMAADDFLAKPFDIDELLLRVGKWAGPGVHQKAM